MTVFYNEVALGRWLEQAVRSLHIKTVLGTVLQHVAITDGRINAIGLASRYGNVQVRADGFVDASGDAALTWQTGLPCWVPERTIYGSQQVIVENVDENQKPGPGQIEALLAARGEEYGLLRRGGLARSTRSSTCRPSRRRPSAAPTCTGCSRPWPTGCRCWPRSGPTARSR